MKINDRTSKRMMLLFIRLFLILIPSVLAQNPGVFHIRPEKGGDYCFLFPSQWIKSYQGDNKKHWFDPESFTQNFTYSAMCCLPSFFGEDDNDGGGFSTRIASIRQGNCNLFQNARVRQINSTEGLLFLGGDAPYPMKSLRSGYNWGHCEEITLPGFMLSDVDILYLVFKNLIRNLLYKTGIIYLMAMGIVAIGSYWAGSTEKKKQDNIKNQGQTQDFDEITIDTNICFTCTCMVMGTFMLLFLYCFYDYMMHAMNGIFCIYASFSLYWCLTPFVNKLPFGEHLVRFPYFHKDLEIRALLLAMMCLSVNATWIIFRNENWWSWVLQDVLGISIGIYLLRTVHMPTLKNCSLFLFTHLFYDILCLLVTPFLTKTGRDITDMKIFGSSNSEEIPFLLKVPILSSTSFLDNASFTAIGLGDVVLPGFLVAYCHRFDVQVESPGIYFLASILAYSYGLLVTFVVATFLQASQSTLLYLVPCILITTLTVAAFRKEIVLFWTGVGSENEIIQSSSQKINKHSITLKKSEEQLHGLEEEKDIITVTFNLEELNSDNIFTKQLLEQKKHTEKMYCTLSHASLLNQHLDYQELIGDAEQQCLIGKNNLPPIQICNNLDDSD
ncbi:signal peptide peptidase-like 2B [Vipera latastei]